MATRDRPHVTLRRMPEWSRSQLLVYAAIAAATLLLGARWIRSSGDSARAGSLSFDPAPAHDDGAGGLEASSGDAVVHVAGAVARPGVYRMPGGSRVADAIERAGGPTGAAATDAINLAAKLADGQQIVVPPKAASPVAGTTAPGGAPEGPISLGSATVEQLDTIEGIGPVTAAEIVEFRDSQGGVSSVEDLDRISGIGPTTMEALRSSLQP